MRYPELSRRQVLSLASVAAVSGSGWSQLGAGAQPEVRAVWVHPQVVLPAGPDLKSRAEAFVGKISRGHFNRLLVWVTVADLAGFKYPQFKHGTMSAEYDPVGQLLDAAEKLGIGVHLWYSFTGYRYRGSPDFDPAVGGDPSWAARKGKSAAGSTPAKVAEVDFEWVCPQHVGARDWQRALLVDALRRYPKIQGIHVEEPGYDTPEYCLCDLCQRLFRELYGKSLIDNFDGMLSDDFRVIGNTAFMADLFALTQGAKISLSATGGSRLAWERRKGRDWARWAGLHWLDYYAPQLYFSELDTFKQVLASVAESLGAACKVYPGIAIKWTSGSLSQAEVMRQINAVREAGLTGFILFSATDIDEQMIAKVGSL